MNRIKDVLEGREENYILPLLWQRGEDEARIREEMARVHQAGIHAVCAEARPHPDFLGEKWWQDMDVIMDEARTRGMRVWLLDDDHFPTGHAAGKMKDAPAELHRLYLKEGHVDAIGPLKDAAFLVNSFLVNPMQPMGGASEVLAVVAAQRQAESALLTGEYRVVTDHVRDGVLYWDVPEGTWRIFVIQVSHSGGSPRQADYINVLDPASVRVLIDTVYEAHYQRYQVDFGKTFAGFFSDEPGFYNDRDTFDYDSALGKKGVDLLWRRDLLEQLSDGFGRDFTPFLPLLWHDDGQNTGAVRYAYMDLVTRLYADHFTTQIGDWCREHRVEYIGHVLEDNGVHARLGAGPGHYFRALWGQDMAGLDVVLWQLAPGFNCGPYAAVAGDADGEFFHFGLGKLGSSLAHLDPKKRGRAMCEVYGAFGWAEGLKFMKWMTDHLLVRGVNNFVPHAFSQKDFPDWDCPPHFYARGKNPQYRHYSVLNRYINRACHLLNGGRHVASAAVLYHAEAEWSGAAMPFERPVRVLLQHQVDCDVVPADVLLDSARIDDGKLVIGEEDYRCLVLPMAEALPTALLHKILEMAEAGLPIFIIDRLPLRSCEGSPVPEALASSPGILVVPFEELPAVVRAAGCFDITVRSEVPDLRHYHLKHPGLDVYLFFNEHPYELLETEVMLPESGEWLGYDALENQLFSLDGRQLEPGYYFSLQLSPYQTILVVRGVDVPSAALAVRPMDTAAGYTIQVNGPWKVETATAEAYPQFSPYQDLPELVNLNHPDFLPRFSGTFRYTGGFSLVEDVPGGTLDLGAAYETAEVWVNGQHAGVCIAPPYRFRLEGCLKAGWNELAIEVTNTLVKDQQDFLSRQTVLEPGGLLGPVKLALKNL